MKKLLGKIKEFKLTKERLAAISAVLLSTVVFYLAAYAVEVTADLIDSIFDCWLLGNDVIEFIAYAICLTPAVTVYSRLVKTATEKQ